MEMSIDKVTKASPEEWDKVWRGCDYATYFHSREWAEVWQDYTEGEIQPSPSLVYFTDGKKALLPLSCHRSVKWLRRKHKYLSSPAGTYGGWLSDDVLDMSHAKLLGDYLLNDLGSLLWRINPYDELAVNSGIVPSRQDETHAIELTPGFEAIFKGWTKGHRSAAKKAQREGVEIRLARSPEDWEAYFLAYQDSLERWGNKASSQYKRSLFDGMRSQRSQNILLWLATFNGRVIAGCLCLYAKHHVAYWHGAAVEEYFKLRPVHLLVYEIVRNACDKNYQWFDFNPSGGHEGVMSFKKSFGAQPLPCPLFIK